MDAILWLLLPLVTAVGSALLAYFIMQSRMEVAVAREREALVEARARISQVEHEGAARLKATEEEVRRRSFDEFLADIRTEERHYMRESKSLFLNRRTMVLQERLYFRNIPLSNWIEHELVIEEDSDVGNLARACSAFLGGRGAEPKPASISGTVGPRLLDRSARSA